MRKILIQRKVLDMRFMVIFFILCLAACNGNKGDEDTQVDTVDTMEVLDDVGSDVQPDDGVSDIPMEGDPADDPLDADAIPDGPAGCTPEACDDYCNSIGLGPGECEDDACWCRGTTDATVDPDVPYDTEVEEECLVDGDCDDGNPCTQDVCVPATRTCEWYPLSGDFCDDGIFCNGHEMCGDGTCVAGEDPCYTDEPLCTIVTCDEDNDECDFEQVPDNTPCDDGLWCNGPDICLDGFCQRPGPFPCPMGSEDPCMYPYCNEDDDVCEEIPKPDGMLCADEFACNGNEVCIGGVCMPGEPFCDDDDPCTEDICHEGPDPTCEHIPIC